MGTVLVAGATGLVGEAAMMAFAAAGWSVIGVSRRTPDALPAGTVRHIAVDLTDAQACQAAMSGLQDVTHVVYAALYEKPGLLAGWREADQMETNRAMFRNLMAPLLAAARLEHVTLLQGTKAYGAHIHAVPIPARERAPRDDHANFYWLQEDDLREQAQSHGFAWTIFRPQIVVGAAWGAAMNPLLAIGAYAALLREEDRPLAYPGGAPQVMELADPRLLGQAFVWAASAPAAAHETFNITNGDVFAWAEVWPAIADALGMPTGPDRSEPIAPRLAAGHDAWAGLVGRHGLRDIPLPALLGESHHYADALLRPGVDTISRPILVSTIKLRQAGFGACYDTEDTLRYWLDAMVQRRLLPPPRTP
jgi:nucleoside-diphosphate-sugar epimerase